jgi:hypothetical protein
MNSVVKEAELVPPVGAWSADVEVSLSRADPTLGSLEFCQGSIVSAESLATEQPFSRPETPEDGRIML